MPIDLDRLAFEALAATAGIAPDVIEGWLTADIDAAIAAAEAGGPLSAGARNLHGLSAPPPVPEQWRGVPLHRLRAERASLVRDWNAAVAAADYRADKLDELDAAPDAAAAADAASRWNLLGDAPRLTANRPEAAPAAPLPGASNTEVHAAVLHGVAQFFAHMEDKPRILLTAETGSRKSAISITRAAIEIDARKEAGTPHRGVLVVPSHALGGEMLPRAEAAGIN